MRKFHLNEFIKEWNIVYQFAGLIIFLQESNSRAIQPYKKADSAYFSQKDSMSPKLIVALTSHIPLPSKGKVLS